MPTVSLLSHCQRFQWTVLLALLLLIGLACGVAAEETGKVPVPDAAAQAKAARTVAEVFRNDIAAANTPAAKRELAGKLLQTAGKTTEDKAGRYALLIRASATAAEAGDLETAFAAVDQINQVFQADALRMKSGAAIAVQHAPRRTAEQSGQWVAQVDPLIDQAVREERFDLAQRLAEMAINAARAAEDPPLFKHATARAGEIKLQQSESADAQNATAALTRNPADAEASLKLGKYRCFVKGDWETGLPLLARGSDPALKAAAGKELAKPAEPVALIAVGDAWWDLAQTPGPNRPAMRHRSAKWYAAAMTDARGLYRTKAAKRLALLEASDLQSASLSGKTYSVPSNAMWNVTDFAVEAGKCYQIRAVGKWTASAGPRCGPEGICPAELFVPLGAQPRLKDTQKKEYYEGYHPRGALICKIGQEKWTFYVGAQTQFIAPVAGPLSFRINDTDDPSTDRSGQAALTVASIAPHWVPRNGQVEILARIDDTDMLHLTRTGLYWEWGGSWGKVGLHDGYWPTIINGILWWPAWADRTRTVPLNAPELWPASPRQFKLVREEAPRGKVDVLDQKPDEIVLRFRDHGGGSSQVGCVIEVRE